MIWIQSRNGGICAYLPFHKYFDKAENMDERCRLLCHRYAAVYDDSGVDSAECDHYESNPLFGWRRSVQRRTRYIGYICVGKERPGLMEVSVSKSTKDCEKDVFNNS